MFYAGLNIKLAQAKASLGHATKPYARSFLAQATFKRLATKKQLISKIIHIIDYL